ncbi:MAG: hypothetical protein L6Q99_12860 [Planctomycetes bacterium]|nr:hypothetical protein [Planctomycetota bacterium]
MHRLTLVFAVVMIAAIVLGVVSIARRYESAARAASAAERVARLEVCEAAQRVLRDELAQAELPSWAGEYVHEGGHGRETVLVAPRNGFAYFGGYCGAKDALTGSVEFDGNTLRLVATVPPYFYTGVDFPAELVPVEKGSARFLLRGAKQVIAACNASSGGRIPALGFAHVDNGEVDPLEPLVVPPSFQKYQLATPIVGRVTLADWVPYVGYEGKPGLCQHVRLDIGADERALVGMTYFVPVTPAESGGTSALFTVESAEPGAELELFAYVPQDAPLPRIGVSASTDSR